MRRATSELVKRVAAGLDVVRRRRGITILIYHRVGGLTGVSVDLPTELFAEQMATLRDRFRVLTIDDAVAELSQPSPPADADEPDTLGVVVTFDDGTADFVDHALPVLADHDVPATLYLATDHIDSGRPFPDDGAPISWPGVREAIDSGLVTVGSHTHSHLLLDRALPTEAADDLDRSISAIEDRLGHTPEHFAYPKAVPASAGVEVEVRRRFATAALAGTRPNRPGHTDLHRLARSPVQVTDGMRWFEAKAAGGLGLEDDLRGVRNRWRYRDATH